MGLTFRKSIRLGKYLRVNFSKRGPSISAGPRGAKINIGADGKERITIAKDGMRYTKQVSLNNATHPAAPQHASLQAPRTLAGAYLCFVLLGSHYLYFKKPGVQLLFWITLGGVGVWAIADFFRMKQLVDAYNASMGLNNNSES